jgi:tetratricopeptide (TPR) repeat protein
LTFPGCARHGEGPYASHAESARQPRLAESLNAQAAALIAPDPDKAEKLLREALNADLYCGPAHNNLGVIHLMRGRLYEAAGEFEWARKLMPGHPDPRVNLALALERAGRTNDALAAYATALEVYPEYVPAMQGLVRLQVRADRADERTTALLREIAMRGEDEAWRSWAKAQLARLAP